MRKDELLEQALFYASLGWHVLPLHSPQPDGACSCPNPDCDHVGKHPKIKEWQHNATTDEKIIREWWNEWPDANIGIQTGEKSGLVVLDFDIVKGGDKSLKLLIRMSGELTDYVACKTGGGYHLYFAHSGARLRNKQALLPGFDLRGDGGYVVAPPSLHKSGKKYCWEPNRHPEGRTLPQMPESLINFINTPLPSGKTGGIEKTKEGSRNAWLFRIAAAMRGKGMEYDAILERVKKINESFCEPPLSESEVEKAVGSASKYEPDGEPGEKKEKVSQSQELLSLAAEFELFHTPEKRCFMVVPVGKGKDVLELKEKKLRLYLGKLYFDRFQRPPNAQALKDTIEVLSAKALYGSEEKKVFTRTAMVGDTIFIDLCSQEKEVVQITPAGWDVITHSPVHFVAPDTMKPLPRPQRGGSIEQLRALTNVKNDDHWILMVAWMIMAFIPNGPFPILVIQGEQGSSKSTTTEILKAVIDPTKAPVRSTPMSERDLCISADKSCVLAFDNLSGMQNWLSDALCRLATGLGFIVRGLFTDSDEVVFEASRPIVINGIEDLATRNDLADRSIIIYLPTIPKEERRQKNLLWKEFEQIQPLVFGALLDAISMALRNYHSTTLTSLPRMADFAHWITAAEPALPWESGRFMEAYERNQKEALNILLESDILATIISSFMKPGKTWEGTATELLDELREFAPDETAGNRSFPKAANTLTNRLRRIAPSLRSEGIDVTELTFMPR